MSSHKATYHQEKHVVGIKYYLQTIVGIAPQNDWVRNLFKQQQFLIHRLNSAAHYLKAAMIANNFTKMVQVISDTMLKLNM